MEENEDKLESAVQLSVTVTDAEVLRVMASASPASQILYRSLF